METVRRLLFGLGMSIAFSFSSFAQNPAAVVIETEKIVETQAHGAAWRAAAAGLQLGTDHKLRTGEFSRATVRLSDLTVMRLDEFTTIEISHAIAAQNAGTLDTLDTLGVKRGGIYYLHRGKPQRMRIRTASANGALKGTEFAMRVDADGKTTVAVFEGEFELSNAQGRLLLRSNEVGEAEVGRAPRPTSKIEAANIIQWCLYYPGVLDPADFGPARSAALEAYRAGDLPRALAAMKSSDPRLLRAALILSSGQVEKARAELAGVRSDDPARRAIERMIAAVQHREWTGGEARTAGEWVAESYYQQSRGELEPALEAARKATALSPEFGFAWVRAAEMEFSFGRTLKAMKLLERGLELSPRNAQALALQGFLLAAENRTGAARRSFDAAIAIDGALGNAWLGRGLTSIRQGREEEGRLDLQTAAVLEPTRAALRSYLGKAFSEVGGRDKANIEFARAKELDPRDPTPWLYSAIQRKQENRYNEAVADLEKSIGLNQNRNILRSEFLLDQDRSIRGTNLAAIFANNGMTEQSVREAVRAVDANYASAPAHLFLANSYDALRDPTGVLTRFESATFNELLLSHLLSPVGGGPLSQFVSQQEYSKLFEKDGVGFATDTTYFSTGEFRHTASQFGTVGNLGYALDAYWLHGRGPRLYHRLTTAGGFGTFKLQLGPQDTVFFQTAIGDTETGDVTQQYDPNAVKHSRAALTHDFQEKQDPGLLLLGWQREWSPGNRTLLLLGRLANRQSLTSQETTQSILDTDVTAITSPKVFDDLIHNRIVRDRAFFDAARSLAGRGALFDSVSNIFDLDYRASFETWSADLQHIATLGPDTVIVGGRYQRGQFDTSVRLTNFANGDGAFDTRFYDDPPAAKSASVDFERINLYLYNVLHVTPWLSLTGGVAYDHLRYPDNFRSPPINDRETSLEHVSPKAGFSLRPWRGAILRGAFTEAVSGTSFDESIRLEPAQVAGFLQSYRSLVSESLTGAVAGSKYRLFGLSFEQKLPTRTYFGIEWNVLTQNFDRTLGVFERAHIEFRPLVVVPGSLAEKDRYREDSIAATVNQLIGERWSLGARYRYTHSDFRQHRDGFGEALDRPGNSAIARENLAAGKSTHAESGLHELSLFALYNHPSGFFARAEANWYRQRNDDYISLNDSASGRLRTGNFGLEGDDFWQVNALAGWRFHRNQCELSCGLLNIAGQDYRLSPLNPHEELARDRTFVARCKLSF